MNDIKKQISFIKEKGGTATLDEICKAYSKKYTMFITPEHKDVIRRTLNRYPELVTNKGNDVYSIKEEKKMVDEQFDETVRITRKQFKNKIYSKIDFPRKDVSTLVCEEYKDENLKPEDMIKEYVISWLYGTSIERYELNDEFIKRCEECGPVCFGDGGYNSNEHMKYQTIIGKAIDIGKDINILKGGFDAIINEKPIGNVLYTSVNVPELCLTFVYRSTYSDDTFADLEERELIGFFEQDLVVTDAMITECEKGEICIPVRNGNELPRETTAEENLKKLMNEKVGRYHMNNNEYENELIEMIFMDMPVEFETDDFDGYINNIINNWFTTDCNNKKIKVLEDYLDKPAISSIVNRICKDVKKHYDLVK